MTMQFCKFLGVAAAVLFCGGLAARANAGTLTYNGYGFSGENIHFSDAALGIDNEYGGSGLITLDGPTPFQAYCVDIADWLLSSGTYATGVDPASNPNLTGTSSITGDSKTADILALIVNGTDVAAVQLAIWETEFGSAATFTPDDPNLQAVATSYLGDVHTGLWKAPGGAALFELVPADGQVNQTLIYDPIPEPDAAVILGSGLLMLGCIARRRKEAGTAPGRSH
jgi:hypothetical protein